MGTWLVVYLAGGLAAVALAFGLDRRRGKLRKRDHAFVLLFWPLAGATALLGMLRRKGTKLPEADPHDLWHDWAGEAGPILKAREDNLIVRLSPEEAEAREWIEDPLGAVPAEPFGHRGDAWRIFKADILPHDELWSFRTKLDPNGWQWSVVSGYALKRDGHIVAEFIVESGNAV